MGVRLDLLTLFLIFLPTLPNAYDDCRFIQNSAEVPKKAPRSIAMSALMPLFLVVMSLTLWAVTPMALANA